MTFDMPSSPLKVKTKKADLVATGPGGGVVLQGTTGGDFAFVCQTAEGAVTITHSSKGESAKFNSVRNAAGLEVARIEHHMIKKWQIRMSTGESIPVTSGRAMLTGHGCKIGDLAKAKAPWLAPQRYFKLTLSDELLHRPDCVVISVIAAWVAEVNISASISASVSSGG